MKLQPPAQTCIACDRTIEAIGGKRLTIHRDMPGGDRPWICMPCAGFRCNTCGGPVDHAHGRDVLYIDGSIAHMAMLPIRARCISPGCSAYAKSEPVENLGDWGIN